MIKYVLYVAALVLLGTHLALSALYTSPENPIKTQTTLDQLWVGSLFYQKWTFFAPNPPTSNNELVIECHSQTHSSGPLEVLKDMYKAHQRNRFTPMERLARVPEGYAFRVLSVAPGDEPYIKICQQNPQNPVCAGVRQRRLELMKESLKRITPVAGYFCADISAQRNLPAFNRATLWIETTAVPRWSQRYASQAQKKQRILLGQLELPESTPLGIWK
ncbi:MAG: hypothetical protein HC933_03690 [Pleurocapsa sp. SU_196_0]|nr:hypothetical protein [Pleurocapsa sp. SU_196_0]